MGLRVEVLGPLRLDDGEEIALERASHRRLLAILVLHADRSVTTDVLIDRFWPEGAPPTARAALQTHVSALRRRLRADFIRTERGGYRLDLREHELDAREFCEHAERARWSAAARDWEAALESLGHALALCRGQPYAELYDDEFARAEIARLEELHVALLELRAEGLLALGRELEAVPDLERLVVEHPFRERLWEHLMTARYRQGRHAEALAAYREAWLAFAEIGLEPSDALRRLEQRILRHDARLTTATRHNLPAELTTFVGREAELAEVTGLLARNRMTTLTGPGGVGKTRLALRAATQSLGRYPDGCWVARLATLGDDDRVPLEVARAAGMRVGSEDVLDVLAETIAHEAALIVLDNCEHLVDECARVARTLLEAGPEITVLATSREPLRVPGEMVYEVPPMSCPDDGTVDAHHLESFDAAALFAERAALARPSFALDPRNSDAVGRICRRLDGLPLAIELAAARIRSLDPEAIAERLDDRFRILVGGSTASPSRHRTLEAALGWSFDLLGREEQVVLARLSVFRGGFTLEMAEAVCAGEGVVAPDVAPIVSALVDKSLASLGGTETRGRYRLLETVREYAARCLAELDDVVSPRQRHLKWCVGFARDVTSRAFGVGRWALFERLAEEADNLQAALDWARTQDRLESVEPLLRALGWHWWDREHLGLAISALEAAVEGCSDPKSEGEIRALLGAARSSAGDGPAALSEIARAHELVAGLEPSPGKVWVLERHASFHLLLPDSDPAPAVPLARAAAAEATALGDPVARVRAGRALARSLVWNGELDEGLSRHRASLRLALALDDPATLFDTYALSYDLLYLHPVARRSEPRRVTEEILARFGGRWATHAYRWRIPYVFCQSGEWDRAEDALEVLGRCHLEGYDRVGLLVVEATLRWMQGRLDEAQADLDRLLALGVNPRWYHDYYPLVGEVAAEAGRLADVRDAAETYLALPMDPTEEARKLAVLSVLTRAEADAALATRDAERAEHVARARTALASGRRILEQHPPPTEGSLHMETHRTHLALAFAETSRVTDPEPERWREVVRCADSRYLGLYARWRLAESLFQTGRDDAAEMELLAALDDAASVGAERLRRRLALRAGRTGDQPGADRRSRLPRRSTRRGGMSRAR
jgi:predicted ATPase/DNA-binding SARP family transcriptional activator